MTLLCLLALSIPGVFWDAGPDTAAALKRAGITKIAVAPARQNQWKGQPGISVEAVDLSSRVELTSPRVQMRRNVASATRSPWIDTNGWRFLRESKGSYYYKVEGARATLAAAEAFVFGGDALVQTDAEGLAALGQMLAFLRNIEPADLPPHVNIGYIDDGSAASGALMNLMVRKNLLFRVVPAPDLGLDLNVRFGVDDYLTGEVSDPSRLAQKVRAKLTDDRRLLRVFGTETVVGRLMGDDKRVRVHLLNYAGGRRSRYGIRVRVLGRYQHRQAAVFGVDNPDIQEYVVTNEATEFTIPEMGAYAVIDLSAGGKPFAGHKSRD